VLDSYDKVHLVPFGEYLPYQSFLESLGLEQLTRQCGGFEAGDRLRTLEIPNASKAGILVCYEAIFPGEVLDPQDRPSWLINVTNDAWFGTTPGPYQHLLAARSRSIEEGLPMVRAANSGISAVIDPLGRTVAALPLGTTGVLDSNLPLPVEVTTYGRGGDLILVFILIPALLIPIVARLRS
jgi:apolipoprotein N-acyltransferase